MIIENLIIIKNKDIFINLIKKLILEYINFLELLQKIKNILLKQLMSKVEILR